MKTALTSASRRSVAFKFTTAFVLTGLLGLGTLSAHAGPAEDTQAIRHVLMKTFDRPDARLSVDPVVIHKNHAIAAWQQGERGGRALMRRSDDGRSWEINLCSGDGLRQARMLEQTGMPAADAKALAQALARAESRLDKATLARLASFEGTVHMGPNGEHPPVAGHGGDAHGGHGAHAGHAGHAGQAGHGTQGEHGGHHGAANASK